MAISKKELTELVQKLPEKDVVKVADFIHRLIAISDEHIPFDDEPLTDEDLNAIKDASKEFEEGKTVKFEDILHELQN